MSKKDATLVMNQKGEVHHEQVVLEKYCNLEGKPGKYYLGHISTQSDKGRVIAEEIKDAIAKYM